MNDDEIVDAELIEPGAALEPAGDGELIGGPLYHLDALPILRSAVLALDDERTALVAAGDVDRLANGAADLKVLLGDLNAFLRGVRVDLARLLIARHEAEGGNPNRRPKVEVEGLGVVEVPSGRERKNWDSPGLLRHLITQAIADPETGEMRTDSVPEAAGAILEVLMDCLPVTASLGWRVGTFDKATDTWTGLRKYEVELDAWSDEVEKERLAEIPKRRES